MATTSVLCTQHENSIEGYSKYACQYCLGCLFYKGKSLLEIQNLALDYRMQNLPYFTTTVSNLGMAKPLTDITDSTYCALGLPEKKPVENKKSVKDIVNYFYHK